MLNGILVEEIFATVGSGPARASTTASIDVNFAKADILAASALSSFWQGSIGNANAGSVTFGITGFTHVGPGGQQFDHSFSPDVFAPNSMPSCVSVQGCSRVTFSLTALTFTGIQVLGIGNMTVYFMS